MRRTVFAIIAATAIILTASASPAAAPPNSNAIRRDVTVAGIREHQAALQQIADDNGGTRASGTPGYGASGAYVVRRLRSAGYNVRLQRFKFPFFQETAPAEFERVSHTPRVYGEDDFAIMDYSAGDEVTGTVQAVNLTLPPPTEPGTSPSGCEPEDFAGFTAGNVALIQRGTCDFAVKAGNAEAAGASAVIIFNEGQEGRTEVLSGTLGGPDVTIPVIGASFAVGAELAGLDAPVVRIFTSTVSEERETFNVIGDTPKGRNADTIVVTAHLDSVIEGPGINDNGSGVGTILEIAEEIGEDGFAVRNKVRFIFFGAEESGLLGSYHYVDNLKPGQKKNIAVNLNFDMVGSPNYVRFVYDGDGSDSDAAGPTGSRNVERMFIDYFNRQGLTTEPTAFDGRSDYGPFIEAGIPAGGLFTGAEGEKTPEEAEVYGGTAGEAYDPCYHEACDTFDNNNSKALDEMSDAAAHAVWIFANTTPPGYGPARDSSPARDANSVTAKGQAKSAKHSHLTKS